MQKKNSIEEELKGLILTLGKRQPHLEERNVFHSVLKDKDFLKKLNDLVLSMVNASTQKEFKEY